MDLWNLMIVDTVTDEDITAFPNLSLLPIQSFFLNLFKMFVSNILCDSVCLPPSQVAICYLYKRIHWIPSVCTALMQLLVHWLAEPPRIIQNKSFTNAKYEIISSEVRLDANEMLYWHDLIYYNDNVDIHSMSGNNTTTNQYLGVCGVV